MAKDYLQIRGADLVKFQLSLSKYPKVRFHFALSVKNRCKGKVMNVKNTFVNMVLNERECVRQAEGFVR